MHKLAEVIDVKDCHTINEVLNKSMTAWEPCAKPISSIQENKASTALTVVQNDSFHAIIRPDTMQILGVCSKRYKPNSHVVHLARLDNMVRNGDLVPERVSLWGGGSLMAFQFRAPALDAEILPGDSVSPLLTLAFYNDGKHGDMSFFADFRWACTNQMGKVHKAMAGKNRAAHRGDVHGTYERYLTERIEEMRSVTAERYETMKQMTGKPLVEKGLLNYWAGSMMIAEPEVAVEELLTFQEGKELSPNGKVLTGILEAHREDSANAPGTVWHGYNALTRYLTHKAGRNEATRARRALMGDGVAMDMAYVNARALVAA